MVTFKRVEGELRHQAEQYLDAVFAADVNVYAAFETGLVGAGALRLDDRVIRIEAFDAQEAYRDFTLRSLVFAAVGTGLTVEGSDPALEKLGFARSDGVYRCAAADVTFACQCGKEEVL